MIEEDNIHPSDMQHPNELTMEERDNIDNDFTYHPATGNQEERYKNIRERAKALLIFILEWTPESREQSLAVTKLQEAVMWANAAIACNELKRISNP